jgi:hypothetical protein
MFRRKEGRKGGWGWLGNVQEHIYIYIYLLECKSDEIHTDFLCILYYTIVALHVSGAICTHNQEHKLQSTAVGTRDCYGVSEVG